MTKEDIYQVLLKHSGTSTNTINKAKIFLTSFGLLPKNTRSGHPEVSWIEIYRFIFTVYAGGGDEKKLKEFCARRVNNDHDLQVLGGILEALEGENISAVFISERFVVVMKDNAPSLFFGSMDEVDTNNFTKSVITKTKLVQPIFFKNIKKAIDEVRQEIYN